MLEVSRLTGYLTRRTVDWLWKQSEKKKYIAVKRGEMSWSSEAF